MLRSGGLQSGFDGSVNIRACLWSKTEKSFDKLTLAIEHECLRDAGVVAEQESYEIVVRLSQCVLNAEVSRELRHLLIVAWSTHVEPDYDQSLVFVFLLQPYQMRHAIATRSTPRRVKIEDQHLAFVLGENRSFPARLPTHFEERCGSSGWRHGIRGARGGIGDDWCVRVGNRRVVAVAAR